MPVPRLALLGDLDAISVRPPGCRVLARPGASAAEVLAVQIPELEDVAATAVRVHLGAADLAGADESPFHADVVALCDGLLNILPAGQITFFALPASPGQEELLALFNASLQVTLELRGIGWTGPPP